MIISFHSFHSSDAIFNLPANTFPRTISISSMLEQHPVPQNVTTFQFRLIGDMTLKQFGYLAGGAILAYISYNLPLPFFFRYPLTGIFVLGGIGFAFVPIEERPMDVWFLSFIKSIYSPTQYLWQREAPTPQPVSQPIPAPVATPRAVAPVISPRLTQPIPSQPKAAQPSFWSSLFRSSPKKSKPVVAKPATPARTPQVSPIQPAFVPSYPSILASAPIPSIAGKHLNLQSNKSSPPPPAQPTPPPSSEQNNRINSLEQKLKEMEELLQQTQVSKQRMGQLQEQLVNALNDKEKLQQELEQVKKVLQTQQKPQEILRRGGETTIKPQQNPTVNIFTPDAAKNAGIPTITSFPNVVTGIVRERNGNLLVAILVTVKDKDDIPVRALKTNKLGQFGASTPLPDGTYTLDIEDPKGQFLFDRARVILNGTVLPPLDIIAKTKQELERQKLEEAVFGKKVT